MNLYYSELRFRYEINNKIDLKASVTLGKLSIILYAAYASQTVGACPYF